MKIFLSPKFFYPFSTFKHSRVVFVTFNLQFDCVMSRTLRKVGLFESFFYTEAFLPNLYQYIFCYSQGTRDRDSRGDGRRTTLVSKSFYKTKDRILLFLPLPKPDPFLSLSTSSTVLPCTGVNCKILLLFWNLIPTTPLSNCRFSTKRFKSIS